MSNLKHNAVSGTGSLRGIGRLRNAGRSLFNPAARKQCRDKDNIRIIFRDMFCFFNLLS